MHVERHERGIHAESSGAGVVGRPARFFQGVFWLIRTWLGSRTEDARTSKRHPTRGNTMYIGIGTVVLIVIIVLVVLMLRRR
jgi:serine acetyltransferase